MFQLRDNMDQLQKNQIPSTLSALADDIQKRYGGLDHKLNFTQNLRSSSDYVYKHSISVAILSAMIANELHISGADQLALITAALLYDFGYLYVPQALLEKGGDLTDQDQSQIQMNLERGYELIRPRFEECELPRASLTLIQQIVFRKNTSLRIKAPSEPYDCHEFKPDAGLRDGCHDIFKGAERFLSAFRRHRARRMHPHSSDRGLRGSLRRRKSARASGKQRGLYLPDGLKVLE